MQREEYRPQTHQRRVYGFTYGVAPKMEYVPTKPSEEAQICLECPAKKCSGECKRLKIEKRKLKEKKHEKMA